MFLSIIESYEKYPISILYRRCIASIHAVPVSASLQEDNVLTYYISTEGNDHNNGRKSTPMKSIHRAQDLAAASFGNQEIHFVFKDGVHYLDSTLVIRPEQSGKGDCPVIYQAEHRGKAILNGGKPLSLSWKKWNGPVYCASVDDATVTEIDQLYVNGLRKPMARFPNRKGKNVYETWDLSLNASLDASLDLFQPERIASWKNPAGAYLHAMHASLWGDMHWLVKGKGKDGECLLTEGGWQNNRPSSMHPVYRIIENVFEELDEPGEWYYHPAEK